MALNKIILEQSIKNLYILNIYVHLYILLSFSSVFIVVLLKLFYVMSKYVYA